MSEERKGLFRLIAEVPSLIVQLFRDELESFFHANSRAMRAVLSDYAQAQMNVAMSSAHSWKQVVLNLNND